MGRRAMYLSSRGNPFLRLADSDPLAGLAFGIEDAVVARPSEEGDKFLNARTAKHGNREFLRAAVNSRDSNRIGNLTLGGQVPQGLRGDGPRRHGPVRLSPKR